MISDRKRDHVDLTLNKPVEYQNSAGFERVHFRHHALPEIDFHSIKTAGSLFGKSYSLPLFISSMTGGYDEATRWNTQIAEFCEANQLPFGVGSQRAMLEQEELKESFSVVRKVAPNTSIFSNIGGVQLIGGLSVKSMNLLIDTIEADGVIVHLNPLQEIIQTEGDRNFKGVLKGIKQLVQDSPVPVIVKETGAGISGDVAQILLEIGVKGIDVAGSGGTSWSKVEDFRNQSTKNPEFLLEWGIPTTQCLKEISPFKSFQTFTLIASGGIRSVDHMLKAICLGADLVAMAAPIIKILVQSGPEALQFEFESWKDQFKKGMLLLGAEDLQQLGEKKVYLT